ncbi:hypothetical protein MKX01_040164 [Papaver californicum]|nr:hypothetical protein MKX01_040164 [Papaver californicum]
MRRLNAHSPSSSLDPKPEKMDSVKSRSINNLRNWKKIRENLSIFVGFSVIFSVLGYLLLVSVRGDGGENLKKKFSIVIDGGSTGTRIHVFGYKIDNGGKPVIEFGKEELGSMRVTPGLSTFEMDTESAGKSLMDLLEIGKEKIPKEYWEETEIRLMATAGLRRLEKGVLERILESCRRVLRFSGSDEGLHAWVAANYALGTFGGDPRDTTGIIELDGASALLFQVTFVSSEPLSPEFTSKFKIGELTYNLYTHSLLNFGQNVAHDTLMELLVSRELKFSWGTIQDEMFFDPCTARGYLNSLESSNFSHVALSEKSIDLSNLREKSIDLSNLRARGNFFECRSAALMVLQKGKDKCNYKLWNIGSTFIPKLQGRFLATENFFHTSKFYRLPPRAFLSNLALSREQFCNEDRSKLKSKYPKLDREDFQRYCFSSAYIIALQHISYSYSNRVEYAQQVGDIPIDWALGAFILQNFSGRHDWVGTIIGNDTSAWFSFFVVSIILIFTAWSVTKWRKPQLKTIYDLEKGRYIVTRVVR